MQRRLTKVHPDILIEEKGSVLAEPRPEPAALARELGEQLAG